MVEKLVFALQWLNKKHIYIYSIYIIVICVLVAGYEPGSTQGNLLVDDTLLSCAPVAPQNHDSLGQIKKTHKSIPKSRTFSNDQPHTRTKNICPFFENTPIFQNHPT